MEKHYKFLNLLYLIFVLSCGDKNLTRSNGSGQGKLAEGLITSQVIFDARGNEQIANYRIPALVTAPNGDLIAAIDERVPAMSDLRKNRNINIVQRRSTDNGKTWLDIETVINFPLGKSASDPSMIVDEETDEIFLFYNYMDLDNEKDVYYLHVMKSKDNGKSWSEPRDITSEITELEWHNDFKFITSGRGIQTSSGRLLHTMVRIRNYGFTGEYSAREPAVRQVYLFGSDDHGETWFIINSPVEPADESKVIELIDESYMINSRLKKGEGMRYIHVSADKGISWDSRPAPELIDPGNNAGFIRYTSVKEGYEKNRLLFSNARSKNSRENLTVRISYDEGKTWSEGKTIYSGDAAYSTLTVLQNGDIGLLFEKDGYKENIFVSFSLEWLTDGKDNYSEP